MLIQPLPPDADPILVTISALRDAGTHLDRAATALRYSLDQMASVGDGLISDTTGLPQLLSSLQPLIHVVDSTVEALEQSAVVTAAGPTIPLPIPTP